MQATIETKELKKEIAKHKGIQKENTTKIPILEGIALKVEDDCLKLYSTSLDFSLKSKIDSTNNINGQCLIPLKNLEAIVKASKTQTITINKTDDKLQIGNMRLNLLDLEEYPAEIKVEGKTCTVVYDQFYNCLDQLYDCCSKDDTKITLNSFCFNTGANEIIATDAFKLGIANCNFSNDIGKVIIPKEIFTFIKGLKSQNNQSVINLSDKQISINIDGNIYTSRLFAGKYPKYEDLINIDYKYYFGINSEALIDKLEYIENTIKASKNAIPVQLKFAKKRINILCKDNQVGIFEDNISVYVTGEEPEAQKTAEAQKTPIIMHFNPKFLIQILKQFEGPVEIYLNYDPDSTWQKPITINQIGNGNLSFLLMPIKSK